MVCSPIRVLCNGKDLFNLVPTFENCKQSYHKQWSESFNLMICLQMWASTKSSPYQRAKETLNFVVRQPSQFFLCWRTISRGQHGRSQPTAIQTVRFAFIIYLTPVNCAAYSSARYERPSRLAEVRPGKMAPRIYAVFIHSWLQQDGLP